MPSKALLSKKSTQFRFPGSEKQTVVIRNKVLNRKHNRHKTNTPLKDTRSREYGKNEDQIQSMKGPH